MGKSLYLARPIRNESECETCHSVPASAPPTLLARYGTNNGFGWQDHEIVGAQVVSVPFASATENAERAFRGFMISLIAVFAAIFVVINALLYALLVRPIRHIAQIADRVSVGDMSAAEFPATGRGKSHRSFVPSTACARASTRRCGCSNLEAYRERRLHQLLAAGPRLCS